jgi:hypothetical protein
MSFWNRYKSTISLASLLLVVAVFIALTFFLTSAEIALF